ncbi:unnamed protein product [Adineta ricciae]|uniref:non-specific protein-tyrosine kinase n=2 Tax=Adineta ricciae TaxID=249248 RepID=A0A814BLV4_ADIRI|nr:unnamed protein product [Adineta ricciae]CAF0927924.1 unnamed protein product [Adineta ricciae]
MGCIIRRFLSASSFETLRYPVDDKPSQLDSAKAPRRQEYDDDPVPLRAPRAPPVPHKPLPKPASQMDSSRVQLHTPIYIGIQEYQKENLNEISFEKDDEMELIEQVNSNELRVNHLRSGSSGIIPKTHVRIDVDTPLRLAVKESGVIQRCLLHYNIPGTYLIRRSTNTPNAFVLSISQINESYNTLTWHYLISINPSNNCFYFSQEAQLQTLTFTSFQHLIADERIRAVIPLTEIIPYSIEFDEEVWNIPYRELEIEDKIGEGQFGEVYRAHWHKGQTITPIAVKKLHISGITSTIKREIEAMKTLTNLYIVTLYGISQNPTTNELLIVTQLMENGDLKTWLKNLQTLPKYSTLVHFAKDISCGMNYLEVRNYVHRDLACRNILLGPCGKKIKIADFGLSTIVSPTDAALRQEAHSQKLPTRWLAPELLHNQAAYSIKSDVWAFGIVLIELWLKGGDPYGNEHRAWIQSAVSTGHVHEKPTDCPDDFYESVIHKCLQFQANDRPSFSALRQLLEKWQCH